MTTQAQPSFERIITRLQSALARLPNIGKLSSHTHVLQMLFLRINALLRITQCPSWIERLTKKRKIALGTIKDCMATTAIVYRELYLIFSPPCSRPLPTLDRPRAPIALRDLLDRFSYDCLWRAEAHGKRGVSACGVYLPDLEQPRPPDLPPGLVRLRVVASTIDGWPRIEAKGCPTYAICIRKPKARPPSAPCSALSTTGPQTSGIPRDFP
jgi:hypothetical protein